MALSHVAIATAVTHSRYGSRAHPIRAALGWVPYAATALGLIHPVGNTASSAAALYAICGTFAATVAGVA
jgi:hypothetical protein